MITNNDIPNQKPKLFSYPWLLVGLLCVVGALNYLDRMIITTMRTSIVDAIPMTDAQFGLLTSVFLWIYGLLSPVAGFLADRFNRSRVIIGSLFVWSLVTWLTSQATTFEQLLATRALMGISEACYIPAALALIVDYHKNVTKSLATGIHIAGVYVGQSLGFLGGWLAESHSWNYAFSVFGIVGISYAVVLTFLLKDAPKPQTLKVQAPKINFGDALRQLFRQPAYLLALAAWGLLGVASWMISAWLPTYYKEAFSLTQTDAGVYATAYFYVAMFFGVLTGGALADYWSKSNPRARVLLPAISLVLACPGIILGGTTSILWVAVAGFMLYAFMRPFLDANMMPVLSMVSDSRYLATGYGILNLFSCVVGGIGIYAGGTLRDANINLSLMFQVAALTLLVCAFLLYKIPIKNLQQTEEVPEVAAK
ncbi:MFS transporter [Runella zeae]|uniref:MFS transporter n=1 Tax=Runella zeae TaxID=94255 RepID=UPI00041F7BA0|nr:MFS transporter [Runella zeae]